MGSSTRAKLRVAVVTGTRAEFGLLTPVMHAIAKHRRLELNVVAGGAHLLPPARTIRDVEALFPVAARVPMQRAGRTGRHEDALALARGIDGCARAFARLKPDWVVVLGDRIEAFAAASAASIAGIAVCHIHGGDRAEGIADEAMRHAITKLAHLHCAATKLSAQRIIRMGEKPERVHVTGSPAIDGLAKIKPMSDAEARKLGDPRVVVLLHPTGREPEYETYQAEVALGAAWLALPHDRSWDHTLLLHPNSDAGREHVLRVWNSVAERGPRIASHLPRPAFLSLLKRIASHSGVLVGNSSAGLIEAAALRVPVVDIGPRQGGRERGKHIVHVDLEDPSVFMRRMRAARALIRAGAPASSIFGDGRSGVRTASLLARFDPRDPSLLRKRIAY